MHAIAFNALRSAHRPVSRSACRIISGARFPLPRRNFHCSPTASQEPKGDPTVYENTESTIGVNEAISEGSSAISERIESSSIPGDITKPAEANLVTPTEIINSELEQEIVDVNKDVIEDAGGPPAAREGGRTTRTTRTPSRAKARRQSPQLEGLPPASIPDWFIERNVVLWEELGISRDLCLEETQDVDDLVPSKMLEEMYATFVRGSARVNKWKESRKAAGDTKSKEFDSTTESESRGVESKKAEELPSVAGEDVANHPQVGVPEITAKYSIHPHIFNEILTTMRTGFNLRPPLQVADASILRPHTVLECPADSSTTFLDAVVQFVAKYAGADVITLDPQDIAQIIGPYVDENLAWTSSKTSLLGYHAQSVTGELEEYENDTPDEGPDSTVSLESEDLESKSKHFGDLMKNISKLRGMQVAIATTNNALGSSNASGSGILKGTDIFKFLGTNPSSESAKMVTHQTEGDQWNRMKVSAMLDTLIGAADSKRASTQMKDTKVPKLVIQLKDYKGFLGTQGGGEILDSLQTAVTKRWRDGANVLLVGTTATGDCSLSKADIINYQSDIVEGIKRTSMPPFPLLNLQIDWEARGRETCVKRVCRIKDTSPSSHIKKYESKLTNRCSSRNPSS